MNILRKLAICVVIFTVILCASCTSITDTSVSIPTTIPSATIPTSTPTTIPTIETTRPIIPSSTIPSTVIPTTTITSPAPSIDYRNSVFASVDGKGDGSFTNPYSLSRAIVNLTPEKTLYLFGGVYNLNTAIVFKNSGSADKYYKIFAYNNEEVILDFGKDYLKEQVITDEYNKQTNKGIVIKASYYYIKGLTIRNCGSTGIHIYNNYNIIEDCILACNGNTGLNIAGSSSDTIENWPSYNLIKNCTSYGNYDWNRSDGMQGEDADGFGAKLCTGVGNVFDGCIAYNNSDDGWDLFTKHKTGKIGSVTIKNSIAFSNGYSITGEAQMNGNGFKLGGRAIEVDHIVDNCVAFYNKANGFDDNSNPGTLTITNCTSYKNGKKNFAAGRFVEENNTYTSTWYEGEDLFGPIENVPKSHNILKNCISYAGGSNDSFAGTAENCYFYKLENEFRVFTIDSVCNSKYATGTKQEAIMPFESIDISLNDLHSIHNQLRGDDNYPSLGTFLTLNESFKDLNIGAYL